MNYVISDVTTKRKEYTDMVDGDPKEIAAINSRMLSVEKYHELARRIIGKWAPAYAKTAMLNSEDAIDYVAHYIMIGDWGYKPEKSDIKTYRGYCGKKAIGKYLSALSEQQDSPMNLLDNPNIPPSGDSNLYETIPDKNAPQPHDRMETNERREEARRDLSIIMGVLNETQRACIIMHHFNDMPMADIGRELGITREGVRKSIQEAMNSMRQVVGTNTSEKA